MVKVLVTRSRVSAAQTRAWGEAPRGVRLPLFGMALLSAWAGLAGAALPPAAYDLWHDRAVFHFLTTPAQRLRYRRQLEHALRPDGYLVIACFAPDGPSRCSGLPVVRYSAATLGAELGPCFMPLQETQVLHTTPAGATQHFLYMSFRYRAT